MRASRLRHLCIAASVFTMFMSSVRAADINVSNLTTPVLGYAAMSDATIKLANSFTTDAFTGTSAIESVTLKLGGGGYNLSTLSVGIYTNNAGLPSGTQVGTDYTATGPGGGGDYVFSNLGLNRAELNPSSTYWLVVHNTTNTFAMWAYNNTSSGPFNGTNASITVGSLSNPTGTGWNTFANQTFLYSLVGVPEPSTYAMGAVAVMTLAGVARRRKKTTATA